MLVVKIHMTPGAVKPSAATPSSSGQDLAFIGPEPILLKAGKTALLPTGIYLELPEGYEAQIRPRSGLAMKHAITVLNSPGTIDADYRGEIKVLLINLGSDDYLIKPQDRIAQMIISRYEQVRFEEATELAPSERGIGGFGSTGQ